MANRKEEEEKNFKNTISCLVGITILIILVTILSMLVQLIPVIAPVLVLIFFLSNWYLYSQDKPFFAIGFWLLDSEKDRFKDVTMRLSDAIDTRDYVNAAVKNEGIHINQNGRISAKSYRGQGLQRDLDDANATINDLLPVHTEMEKRPQRRYKDTRKHYSRFIGFGIAFFVWLVCILATSDNLGQNFKAYFSGIGETGTSGISAIKNVWSSDKDTTEMKSESDFDKIVDPYENLNQDELKGESKYAFNEILWMSLCLMLFVYVAIWVVCMIVFSVKYKKPPVVDLNNVDTYNVSYVKNSKNNNTNG